MVEINIAEPKATFKLITIKVATKPSIGIPEPISNKEYYRNWLLIAKR